jgi:hypothetical protein
MQKEQSQLLRVQVALKNPTKLRPAVVHEGVTCDNCHTSNIQGVRYQCKDCENYDMCESCYPRRHTIHDMDHHFSTINVPGDVRREMYMRPRYQPYGNSHDHGQHHRRKLHPRSRSPPAVEYHPVFAEMKKREEELSTRAPPNYELEFEQLASMGFDNKPLNSYFLQQYNGDLTRVVSTLLELNDKQQKLPQLPSLQHLLGEMTDDKQTPVVNVEDEQFSL